MMKSSEKTAKRSRRRRVAKSAGANTLTVRKWGNSAGVRIPMTMMRSASLRIDEEVSATIEDGKIIIEKATPRKKYSLKDLLSKAHSKNSHEFIDSSVGNEVW